MQQNEGIKALSVSQASSVDGQCRELCVGPKPVAMTGWKVSVFSS